MSIQTNVVRPSIKDFFVVFCLVFPLFSRWFLPSSLEMPLTVTVFFIPFYLPNILLFVFPFIAIRNVENRNAALKIIIGLQCFLCIIGALFSTYSNIVASLFNGLLYFYALSLALNFTLTAPQCEILKKVLLISLILFSLEIFLFATGIVAFSAIQGTEISGIFRISTTAAAATGSAGLVFMLGVIVFYFYEKRIWGYIALAMTLISILLLSTRGALLAFCIFIVLYLFKYIKKSFKTFLKLFCSLSLLFIIAYKLGYIDPIMERMQQSIEEHDVTSGRDVLIDNVLTDFNENNNPITGLGIGNVYPTKDVRICNIVPSFSGAPHNTYILVLAEQGVLGILFFVLFWFITLIKTRNKEILFPALLAVVLILFNVETIFTVDTEFIFLIAILLMLSLNVKKGSYSE